MDIHRVAYRVVYTYFRGSEIPLHEFDLYVRLVTALLKEVPYGVAIESITGEEYTGTKIQHIRKDLAEQIIETINYKNVQGYMKIDLQTINKEYGKTEYEGGFLQGILGRRFVKHRNRFYTLEGYELMVEQLADLRKITNIPREQVQEVLELKKTFQDMKVLFNMYSDKQVDKFFLLLDEDIRRGDTREQLYNKMESKSIYGRINKDWVDYHISTPTFHEKLTTVLDFTYKLNKLPKTVRYLYSVIDTIQTQIDDTEMTLEELQEQGYLVNIREEDYT